MNTTADKVASGWRQSWALFHHRLMEAQRNGNHLSVSFPTESFLQSSMCLVFNYSPQTILPKLAFFPLAGLTKPRTPIRDNRHHDDGFQPSCLLRLHSSGSVLIKRVIWCVVWDFLTLYCRTFIQHLPQSTGDSCNRAGKNRKLIFSRKKQFSK